MTSWQRTYRKLASGADIHTVGRVQNLREIHELMTDRKVVVLDDGRRGHIVRVDTVFPRRDTTVSVWTEDTERGPGIAKVSLARIVGTAEGAA